MTLSSHDLAEFLFDLRHCLRLVADVADGERSLGALDSVIDLMVPRMDEMFHRLRASDPACARELLRACGPDECPDPTIH